MKINKSQRSNIIFLVIIVLLIIPQTRKPIQIVLHKGLALFSPSVESVENRETIKFEDWKLQDINGNIINFKDLEGKVTLLNFWATWCPPCVAELPYIKDLNADYKDKIEIILVSNESANKVQSFLKAKGFELNSYMPLSEYPNAFDISSIPRTFLIGKNGAIAIDKTGAANWNSDAVRQQIEVLLKE
ncbi:TlpA family protein disulfide reductase [Pontimicrobium sp. IMCC45349]|uniref:TlpA family protein disulfide reductase n=1 Tax=Pontimicrobium sp. IMCC45349 TaxID=3391574 RepID=UPI0039A01F40